MPATPKRRSGHPDGALYLTSYAKLEAVSARLCPRAFQPADPGRRPGLAKSRSVRAALGSRACWIEGNATPFGMYVKLYRHRDQFVVIDDVDALYADRSGVRLLKCLCQTEEEKSVAWHSDAQPGAAGHPAGVYHQEPGRHHLQRLEDAQPERGGAPGPRACARVRARAPPRCTARPDEWFDDPEIYAWFGANLHRMREPSLRHYVRARELKAAGMDWTDVLAVEAENRRARLAAELLASAAYR